MSECMFSDEHTQPIKVTHNSHFYRPSCAYRTMSNPAVPAIIYDQAEQNRSSLFSYISSSLFHRWNSSSSSGFAYIMFSKLWITVMFLCVVKCYADDCVWSEDENTLSGCSDTTKIDSKINTLTKLKVINNTLSVPLSYFGKFVNLEFLHLEDNKFTAGHCQLKALTKLVRFELKEPELVLVDASFTELKNLQELELEVRSVPANTLETLPEALEKLKLVNVKIGNGSIAINPNYPQLKSVSIIGGQLRSIQFMGEVNALSHLTLSNNILETTDFFNNRLVNIKNLDLSHNRIQQITYYNFNKMPELVELSLAYNEINSVQPNSFGNNKNLLKVDLSNNNLHRLYLTSNGGEKFHLKLEKNVLDCKYVEDIKKKRNAKFMSAFHDLKHLAKEDCIEFGPASGEHERESFGELIYFIACVLFILYFIIVCALKLNTCIKEARNKSKQSEHHPMAQVDSGHTEIPIQPKEEIDVRMETETKLDAKEEPKKAAKEDFQEAEAETQKMLD